MFDKIAAPALSDTVARQLLEQIDGGVFGPGRKLPTEALLAQQFGVSRTVIREAISRLRNEGVVEARQGSGVFIAAHGLVRPLRIDYVEAIEPGALLHLLALRRAIEAEAASEAALRHNELDLASIDAALARIDEAVAEGGDGVAEGIAFHRTIAETAGNPYFLKALAFLDQYLEAGKFVTRRHQATRMDFSRQIREEHAAIAAAIRAGDPMAARTATHTHLYNAARRLTQAGMG